MGSVSNALFIRERRKLIKKLMRKGYALSKIVRKLKRIKDGKYSVSRATVERDMEENRAITENWDKIHNPQMLDNYEKQREDLIKEYNSLIDDAKHKHQYKTASEIIAKKARLLGVDKFVAPTEKKKDEIAEKFKNKSQQEINETLFQEFKDLSAAIIRMVKEGQIGNISNLTIRLIRTDENGKKVKYILTRFGEEKKLYREQEEFKK